MARVPCSANFRSRSSSSRLKERGWGLYRRRIPEICVLDLERIGEDRGNPFLTGLLRILQMGFKLIGLDHHRLAGFEHLGHAFGGVDDPLLQVALGKAGGGSQLQGLVFFVEDQQGTAFDFKEANHVFIDGIAGFPSVPDWTGWLFRLRRIAPPVPVPVVFYGFYPGTGQPRPAIRPG